MDVVEQFKELKSLLDEDLITEAEFLEQKAKLLGNDVPTVAEPVAAAVETTPAEPVDDVATEATEVVEAVETPAPEAPADTPVNDAASPVQPAPVQQPVTGTSSLNTAMPKQDIANTLKNKPQLLAAIAGGVVVVVAIIIGIVVWAGGSDYRHAMKTADSYFFNGQYDDAETEYKKAHDLKATDKSLEYYRYAQDLSQAWQKINWGDFDDDGLYVESDERDFYDNLVSETKTIKDKKVHQEFQDAVDRIANDAGY